jgi:sporulation protein YqfC
VKKSVDNVKYNLSEALELPKDIVMDLPKITMIGNIQLNLSNHKGIIEYTKEIIRVNTNSGVIKVTGEEMEIKTILSEEIMIVGIIEKIEIIS